MDPLTIGIAALLLVITTGGGFIFARQEARIKTLEEKVDTLVDEHMACEAARAKLMEQVRNLESELRELREKR